MASKSAKGLLAWVGALAALAFSGAGAGGALVLFAAASVLGRGRRGAARRGEGGDA